MEKETTVSAVDVDPNEAIENRKSKIWKCCTFHKRFDLFLRWERLRAVFNKKTDSVLEMEEKETQEACNKRFKQVFNKIRPRVHE